MDVFSFTADQLGVTPRALQAALDRGETIASLARSCGLATDLLLEAIVDAEVSDIETLAVIAGFGPADVDEFVRETTVYLREFVEHGEAVAEKLMLPVAA